MQNTEMNHNHQNNTPEWIGAGRYHPDWELKDWKRELERSPDLWSIVDRIEEQSVTRNNLGNTISPDNLSNAHRFTTDDVVKEFVLIQPKWGESDVFWMYDLVIHKANNSSSLAVYIRRINEVYDTTDGMILGDCVVPYGRGEVMSFTDEPRCVLGGNNMQEDELELYFDLDGFDVKNIYRAIQNWAYRSLH